MKLRALHSFLISLNAHVWVVVLLTAALVSEQKPPEPQRIEVQFLKLPAPLEGSALSVPEATRAETKAEANLPRKRVRRQRGPRVEYRVRVARTTASVAARESGTWVPASRIRLRETAVHDSGSRIAGTSPDAAPTPERQPFVLSKVSKSEKQWPHSLVDHAAPQNGVAPDGTEPQNSPGPLDVAGGDTRELIKVIQARIDAVTPLVHASAGPCQAVKGVVHLKFVVNRAGYPCGFRIIASSGVRCLDNEVDNVLHMAEPYPFVAGWIPVTVRFAPRTNI